MQLRFEQVSLKPHSGVQFLLQDISFEVNGGDRIALIGPSGAGKTSLLRLCNRLIDPSRGAIYWNGTDLRQIPVISLRQQVMLMSQESSLLGMTVQETLAYPLRLRKLGQTEIQQRLQHYSELLHLPQEWFDRTEVHLSVGQRQLVAIARSLILQPQILLLDEPTSALDTGRATHVVEVLQQIVQTQQMAIVMVNHQLDIAEAFCSRLLYLQQGNLLQDSPAQQVNWADLKAQLIAAEAQPTEEWD